MITAKSRQFALYKYIIIRISLSAIAGLMGAVLFLGSTAFGTINITSPTPSTIIAESHDFAIDELSDPWDFSQNTDYRLEDLQGIGNLGVGGGVISGRTIDTDPAFFIHFPGYLDAWPIGRDGMRHPIDTGQYRYLSVRMYSSAATEFQVYWFYNQIWSSNGYATYWLNPGWNTFRIDMSSYGNWTGNPIGLRIDPASQGNVDFQIDWIKLHKTPVAANNIDISWDDTAPGGTTNLYLDNDSNPGNGNLGLIATLPSNASNNWTWDLSDRPAGKYYMFANKSGANSAPAGPFEIRSPALIKILDPDEKGGEDYAAAVTGDPWDMNAISDLYLSLNIQNLNTNGLLSGTAVNGDPNFYLRVGAPIDTNRYHRISFSMAYDPPFDFGLGSMARFIWNPSGLDHGTYQTSDDIVVYPQWTEYAMDLKTMKLDGGAIGWNGLMTTFRFDPLEVFNARNFWIDWITLRADDEASVFFPIKWQDSRSSPPPTTVNIYYDNDNKGFNGTLIAQNIPQAAGINTYNWEVINAESGLYYIYIVASDGVSTGRQYSTGPVRITTAAVPRWYIKKAVQGGFDTQSSWSGAWGAPGDIQLVGDFNGDSIDDIALYRPSVSGWYVKLSNGTGFATGTSWAAQWGNPNTEKPLTGDFDGDGKTDIAIYRTGSYPNWFFKLSSGSGFNAQSFPLLWGNPGGDTPIVGDFNGDGKTDIGIYRYGSYPNWFVRLSSGTGPGNVEWGQTWPLSWGNPGGDTPVAGDFNGDGASDIGIYRYGSYPNWFFLNAKSDGTGFMDKQTTYNLSWGNPGGDIPAVGDYNGDGITDLGIFRYSSYPNWFFLNAKSDGTGFMDKQTTYNLSWGNPVTDYPVVGDFSGDGKEDIGLFRRP